MLRQLQRNAIEKKRTQSILLVSSIVLPCFLLYNNAHGVTDDPNTEPDPIVSLAEPTGNAFLEQQIQRGEADAASFQLEIIIQQIEATHHRYHSDLIEPLSLLGDAQVQLGQYDEAVDTYSRARHVARVSEGLFSEAQLPIVYREAGLFKQLGDLDAAGQSEEYAYEISRRIYEGPDPQAIPSIARLANFYLDSNNPISALKLLSRGMAIHERNGSDSSPKAIPMLRAIAEGHMRTRFPPFYVTTADDNRLEGPTPGLTTRDLDSQYVVVNNFPQGERALQKIVEIQREHFAGETWTRTFIDSRTCRLASLVRSFSSSSHPLQSCLHPNVRA